jgi:hypothetical protein
VQLRLHAALLGTLHDRQRLRQQVQRLRAVPGTGEDVG